MTRGSWVPLLLLGATWTPAAVPYTKKCPATDRNVLAVQSVRGRVAGQCACSTVASTGKYVRCVAREVKALTQAGRLTRPCRQVVVAFERKSTCGSAAAVCCRKSARGALKSKIGGASACARHGGAVCGRCDATSGDACAHSGFDACTPDASCAAAADEGEPATVHSQLLPSTDLMLGWIKDIVAQGIRRPGYPADDWTEQWALQRFTDLGLENVRLEPVDVLAWRFQKCTLTVWPASDPGARQDVPCFGVPYSTPTTGLTGPTALLTDGADLSGHIAVVDTPLGLFPQTLALNFATDHYDPHNGFPTDVQILPFSANFQDVMEPAIAAGATGFIGILERLPWDSDQYYVPYEARQRPVPGVWVSESNGGRVKALMAGGPIDAEIVVDATLEPAVSHNVVGTLPGASPEWVIIGSHHDGPWASAVEDASGTSLVMAQALYWSQVPASERPHNLLFLLNGGHMTGGTGLSAFIAAHDDMLDQVVLEVHLEHVAREAGAFDGHPVPTERPEVRWWFTTAIPELRKAVKQTIVREDIDRSLVMRPSFPPGADVPPTDGGFFVLRDVPIVNLLAAPSYLFEAADTIQMIHEPSLVPITRAAARLVAWTRGRTAAGMRAAVVPE